MGYKWDANGMRLVVHPHNGVVGVGEGEGRSAGREQAAETAIQTRGSAKRAFMVLPATLQGYRQTRQPRTLTGRMVGNGVLKHNKTPAHHTTLNSIG